MIQDHTLENIMKVYERAKDQKKTRSLNELSQYIPELVLEIERLKVKHDKKQELLRQSFTRSAQIGAHDIVELLSHTAWQINDYERER